MIVPVLDHILFVFVDRTSKGQFSEKTEWGFEIMSERRTSAEKSRWAKVLAVGPKVKGVKKNDVICIESLMWSLGFEYDNVKIWKTTEEKVLAIDPTVE